MALDSKPAHLSLSNFHSGDDKVEVILRDDFYSQVLCDQGEAAATAIVEEKLNCLFAEIGALAVHKQANG